MIINVIQVFLLEKQHKNSFLRQRDCLSGGEVLQYKHK